MLVVLYWEVGANNEIPQTNSGNELFKISKLEANLLRFVQFARNSLVENGFLFRSLSKNFSRFQSDKHEHQPDAVW